MTQKRTKEVRTKDASTQWADLMKQAATEPGVPELMRLIQTYQQSEESRGVLSAPPLEGHELVQTGTVQWI